LVGVDVDAFVEFVVKQLHEQEVQEGALRVRAQEAKAAAVIPIDGARRRRRRSR
jgi:hypothetical protein